MSEEVEKKEEVKEDKSVLDQIMERLDKLEEKYNGVSGRVDEKAPVSEPASV